VVADSGFSFIIDAKMIDKKAIAAPM